MSGLFYFFEKCGGAGLLQAAGLTDRFDPDAPAFQTEIGATGPEGRSGKVFHRYAGAALPTPLVWRRSLAEDERGRPAFWLGWHAYDPPTPLDLRRPVEVHGFDVVLADQQPWSVPLVLPCTDREATKGKRPGGLPSHPVNRGGKIVWEPLPQYDGLVFEAWRLLESMQDRTQPRRDCLGYCGGLLNVGYRVGLDEVLALDLLTDAIAATLVLASLDWLGEEGKPGERLIAQAAALDPEAVGAFTELVGV